MANDVVSIYERQDKYRHVYKDYTFPPPEQFLNNAAFARYLDRMEEGRCWAAHLVLAEAVVEKYPEAPNPITDIPTGMMAWHDVIIPKHYPDLMLCHELPRLEVRQLELEAEKIYAPRFPQQRAGGVESDSLHFKVQARDRSAKALITLAIADHAPAQLALAKLSDEGKVLRLTPLYMYFITARAKRADLKDPLLQRLYEKAHAAVSQQERARLSSRIETGTWPRTEPLLQD